MRIVLQSVSDLLPLDIIFFRNKFGFKETDSFLLDILKLAIGNIEVRAGISIIEKIWKVVHNNQQIFLYNGPVSEVLSITNSKGEPLTPLFKVRKQDNLILSFGAGIGWVHVTYRAGYLACNLPECLKNSIISEFLKIYDQNERKLCNEMQSLEGVNFDLDCLFG